ncbi:GNAT family N-acetyltransferase [Chitinispirillales bacterium ANBcel5]|uniref:GNAT family N-acetyltransferase n=1 Tax=Cellulosispirillum alkaliphilum TaxID=3039283 RepID=UPI002A510561|nr:GNAT family N-acetyltransferase [Chitinispirillales bacterium ANBcel5]
MRLEEINSVKKLKSIIAQWNDLIYESKTATPFQSPEWILNWWYQFGNDHLRVITVYNSENKLIALAPLFLYEVHGEKTLSFIGSGISDYLDIIIKNGYETQVLNSLYKYFQHNQHQYSIIDLQEVKKDSILLTIKNDKLTSVHITQLSRCPYLILPNSSDEFITHIASKKLRKNIRRGIKYLEKNKSMVSMEIADDNTFEVFMDDLIKVHTKRWKNKGMNGVLSEDKVKKFHLCSGREMVRNNRLLLYRFSCEEKVCAAFYILVHNDCAYGYISGFDANFENVSIGSVCLYLAMKDLIAKGFRVFDFLRGEEDYKYSWGAKNRVNHQIILTSGVN